jgi:histidyl-tRNA synthetase
MNIGSPPGVFDIIPEDAKEPWKSSYLWSYVEKMIRQVAHEFGYREIRTPIFEKTELFLRGVGATSDIVSKEMYTFEDKGKRSMTLRPEGTAPVIRAFIENQLYNESQIHNLFYIAPMFRYDRPQAGRYRQHHQFGVEAIGNDAPEQDVEMIDMLYTLYNRLGLKNLKVYLNTIGDLESRHAFRSALISFYAPLVAELSEDSQARLDVNPLRILDSKDPKDREINAKAPSILDYLSEASRQHFEKVKALLNTIGIPFEINTNLVRGLDYYNKTVFEIVAGELGAQNSIGGGGRYDGLIKTLGGPDLPSIGFGTGIERIIQAMINQNVPLPEANRVSLFLIPIGEEAQSFCFTLLHQLRQGGIAVQMDFSGRKLNKVMHYANTIKAKYVAVIGENELLTKVVDLKEMESGDKIQVHLSNLEKTLSVDSRSREFIQLMEEMSLPFKDQSESEFFTQKISNSLQATKRVTEKMEKTLAELKKLTQDR